jgi:sugar lactone lactonase YvrE
MRLTSDLQLSVVATEVVVPNGMAVDAEGRRLLVCETGADRITMFDIADDGGLRNRRMFADGLPGPDGVCLDAEGAVWVGCYRSGQFLRVHEGGSCTARVPVPHPRWAVAPMLGGADRRTLYLISNDTDHERLPAGISSGYLDAVAVDVPGAGWP